MTDETTQTNLNGDKADDPEEMSSEQIREAALDRLADADGAFLVTGNLEIDDDGDEATAVSVARFAADDLADEDKHAIAEALTRATVEHGLPGEAHVLGPDSLGGNGGPGIGDLLGALMGGATRPDTDDTDEDSDRPGSEGMFQ